MKCPAATVLIPTCYGGKTRNPPLVFNITTDDKHVTQLMRSEILLVFEGCLVFEVDEVNEHSRTLGLMQHHSLKFLLDFLVFFH